MAQKNIKQKDLVKYAGISTSAISDWKKRGTNPSVDKIGLIADCLGVSVNYLLGRPHRTSKIRPNHFTSHRCILPP
jgi:transcriptional regulator with XRE-family HTH domain